MNNYVLMSYIDVIIHSGLNHADDNFGSIFERKQFDNIFWYRSLQ